MVKYIDRVELAVLIAARAAESEAWLELRARPSAENALRHRQAYEYMVDVAQRVPVTWRGPLLADAVSSESYDPSVSSAADLPGVDRPGFCRSVRPGSGR
jgi:hypothetical protein